MLNSGLLYGPLILSQWIVYRLFDFDVCILVHHEERIRNSMTHVEDRQGPRTTAISLAYSGVVIEPRNLVVHTASPASLEVEKLMIMPEKRCKFSLARKRSLELSQLDLVFEPIMLEWGNGRFATGIEGSEQEYHFHVAKCSLSGRLVLSAFGQQQRAGFRCLRIGIRDARHNTYYKFDCSRTWLVESSLGSIAAARSSGCVRVSPERGQRREVSR